MNFDPIYDYSESDLANADNLVYWQFGELIKNLVTLASPAERQIAIIGAGMVCDEMALNFDSYFSLSWPGYLNKNLLPVEVLEKLKELDGFFNERSGGQAPAFWDDSLLATNPDWQLVRQKAAAILGLMQIEDLTIEVDRKEEYEITENGKRLTMQTTKTRLVRKASGD